MDDKPVITVSGIAHSYGETPKVGEALQNVRFTVRRGEFFVLLGPSGCGKSTLLRIIAGLIEPSQGEITFDPTEIHDRLAMVFQNFAIFPWLTVRENAAFGLRMRGVREKEAARITGAYVEELGLSDAENTYPRELSGGMRQRVGIARALAVDPEILLMDEPFSQLDAFTAEKLREEVLMLWRREGFTVVMVTHLIEEAIMLADRIAVMTAKPGRIETIIENTLPRPRNDRDPTFWKIEDQLAQAVRF